MKQPQAGAAVRRAAPMRSARLFTSAVAAACAGLLLTLGSAAHAEPARVKIENAKAWGTAIADYNNDGHDDIYITGHDKNDRIWYWTPNGYVASTQGLELPVHSDRHDCAPADVNGDGRMDFFCAVGAVKGTGEGNNELWVQRPNGTHQMVGSIRTFGAEDPYGRGRRPIFFDLNHDGIPDLFLSNLAETRPDGKPNINHVYLNDGKGNFSEVITTATGQFGSTCVAKGDINGDGWDDLLLCADKGAPHLYLNTQQNNFVELAIPGVTTANGTGSAGNTLKATEGGGSADDAKEGIWNEAHLADMNGDGRDDLVVITSANVLQIWFNTRNAVAFAAPDFEYQLPARAPSLAIGDFNHDGYPDIYVVLRDEACEDSNEDLVSDVWFKGLKGNKWAFKQLDQKFAGCGHMADVLDGDKVLLMNGGGGWRGPNFVLTFKD